MAFTNNPRPLSPGGIASVIRITEANSQSFLAGQPVYYNSGIAVVATSGVSVLGIALTAATNTTSSNTTIPVGRIDVDQDWAIKVVNNGTAAYASTATTGTQYGLYTTGNVCYMDVNNTTNKAVTFLEPLKDELGSGATYWARVRFCPDVIQSVLADVAQS